jgi:hypothetical protein
MASYMGVARARALTESARRADLVARYVALGVPTIEDDNRFAAELGLNVDSLYRLAQAWRLHGEARALHGAYTKITEQDRLDALAATINPELTGVNPIRREDTLRRIEALGCYLAISEPSRQDILRIAASVGLQEQGFRQMLRKWLLHRSPMILPAARRPLLAPQRKKPKIGAPVDDLITQALTELSAGAPAMKVQRRVAALCRDAGLQPPSSSTIYYRVMKARAAAEDTADPHLCIDHSALLLAVNGPDGPQVPVLSLVFARPSGRILAHSLSLRPPSPNSTAALLREVAGQRHHQGMIQSKLDIGFEADGWSCLADTLANSDVEIVDVDRTFKPGNAIGMAIGNIIGNLRTCPRFTRAPVALPSRAVSAAQPFTFEQAVAAVNDAVTFHNEGRPIPAQTFVSEEQAATLTDSLMLIADDGDAEV